MKKALKLVKTKTAIIIAAAICVIAAIFLFFYTYSDYRLRIFYITAFKPYRSSQTIESALKYGDKEFLVELLENNPQTVVLSNNAIYHIFHWHRNFGCRGFQIDSAKMKENTIEILDYLLDHPNIEWKEKYDHSPIYWMMINDYYHHYGRQMFSMAEKLLQYDILLDDFQNDAPLIYFAIALEKQDSDYSFFDLLLANGADINIQNQKGQTSLHLAVQDNIEIWRIEKLLKNRINTNLQDNYGRTALDLAEDRGKNEYINIIREFQQQEYVTKTD